MISLVSCVQGAVHGAGNPPEHREYSLYSRRILPSFGSTNASWPPSCGANSTRSGPWYYSLGLNGQEMTFPLQDEVGRGRERHGQMVLQTTTVLDTYTWSSYQTTPRSTRTLPQWLLPDNASVTFRRRNNYEATSKGTTPHQEISTVGGEQLGLLNELSSGHDRLKSHTRFT